MRFGQAERQQGNTGLWAVAVAALLLLGGAAFYFLRPQAKAPDSRPMEAAAPAPAVTPVTPAPVAKLPPAEETDAKVRRLLGSVAPGARLVQWLSESDLLTRWVVVVQNLVDGESPRRELAFLAPQERFSAARSGSTFVIAPESYARYDAFADVVGSVDAKKLAGVVRELLPLLESAYRTLGHPEGGVSAAAGKALRRLAAAPVRAQPVAVEKAGELWFFADPALEKLGPVEKHLLRMGPKNARIVQTKAREILEALGQ